MNPEPMPGVSSTREPRAPINEAGITATFAAIFARLDAHEQRLDAARNERDSIIARLNGPESAWDARIAAPVAPESVVNVSEVSQEPGNATEAHSATDNDLLHFVPAYLYPEVSAALRVYRKVQACKAYVSGTVWFNDNWDDDASALLAWLKEGEA